MRIRILAAGRPALPWARSAIDDYLGRLSRHGPCQLDFVKAGDPETVSRRLLDRSDGCHRVALDERGESLSTRGLAGRLETLERRGDIKCLCFLVGAADGHNEELRRRSNLALSLSPLTLQHELALVVLLEQLYRVADLRRGGPYHRG
jgi:23S rRNA (pseudouridine1915-N3)-methyltransferase